MKSHVQLLEDTKEYYRTNPRSLDGEFCVYQSENGSRCAIGRILPQRVCQELDKKGGSGKHILAWRDLVKGKGSFYNDEMRKWGEVPVLSQTTTKRMNKLFSEYHLNFLKELQNFHDQPENWSKTTKRGTQNLSACLGEHAYKELMAHAKELDEHKVT